MPHARCVCCAAACFRSELRLLCTVSMRGCRLAVQRGACCVHSCHQIRRCGGAGNCRVKHNRGVCRTHELCAVPRLVFARSYGVYARFWCENAAQLFSGARALCTAATGFAGVAVLPIAELSIKLPVHSDNSIRNLICVRVLCLFPKTCVILTHTLTRIRTALCVVLSL